MRVLITGAAGFLGGRLLRQLLHRGSLGGQPVSEVVLADLTVPDLPEQGDIPVTLLQGNLAEDAYVEALSDHGFDSLFHLASLLTLQAETDPGAAYAVTVGALRRLIEGARGCPKVVFTSSIAIHGGDLPDEVGDDLNPVPATTYGTHKAINELLIADYSRLGRIDGRSLRLPIVLTRPGAPVPAVSDKVAAILREPLCGVDVAAPLAPGTQVPVVSAGAVVAALIRLHDVSAADLPPKRALNLPALTVSVAEMAEAGARNGATGRVTHAPDPQVQRIVDGWPRRFVSERALRLGLRPDADLDAVIADYLDNREA